MHALTSIYDRWRIKLHSVMAEASPTVSASHQHLFTSSSFRTQQNLMATPGELSTVSEGANAASSKTHNATSATVPKVIPKGIPKAVILPGLAGDVEPEREQEAAAEGFLKLIGEDEDNLALQKEKEEEKQKAGVTQGKL